MPHFLDTNILLYSISQNPAESLKRDRADVGESHLEEDGSRRERETLGGHPKPASCGHLKTGQL
jgi:hypothetical protein